MILMKSKSLFFVPYLFLFLEETHVCGLFFDRCSIYLMETGEAVR